MTLQSPEDDEALDEKRDEVTTIKADLAKLRRLRDLAKKSGSSERVEKMDDEIGTQEKYLKDLGYEIMELEVSLDGEPQEEEAETDVDETGGLGAEDPEPEDPGTSR